MTSLFPEVFKESLEFRVLYRPYTWDRSLNWHQVVFSKAQILQVHELVSLGCDQHSIPSGRGSSSLKQVHSEAEKGRAS